MFRLILGILLLLSAGFLWSWVLWPSSYTEKEIALPDITFSDSRFSDTVTNLNSLDLHARLRYPVRLHAGDIGIIQVLLQIPDHGSGGWMIGDDSQAMMEARIDLPLAQLTPQSGIIETLSSGSLPLYRWQVTAGQAQRLTGQFWLYMLLVMEDGSSERQALLAVPFETEIRTLAGLPDRVLIWIASGLTLAGLLVFPFTHSFQFTGKSGRPV